jgi:hypothetical protein
VGKQVVESIAVLWERDVPKNSDSARRRVVATGAVQRNMPVASFCKFQRGVREEVCPPEFFIASPEEILRRSALCNVFLQGGHILRLARSIPK